MESKDSGVIRHSEGYKQIDSYLYPSIAGR